MTISCLSSGPLIRTKCLKPGESLVLHLVTGGLGKDTPLAIVLTVISNPYRCGYPLVPQNVRIQVYGASKQRHQFIQGCLPPRLQPWDVCIFAGGVSKEDWAVLSNRLRYEIEDAAFSSLGERRQNHKKVQVSQRLQEPNLRCESLKLLQHDVGTKISIMECLGRFIDMSTPSYGKRLIYEASERLMVTTFNVRDHTMEKHGIQLERIIKKNFEAVHVSLRTAVQEQLKTIHLCERFFEACAFCVKSTKGECSQCEGFEYLLESYLNEISEGYAARYSVSENAWRRRTLGLPPRLR